MFSDISCFGPDNPDFACETCLEISRNATESSREEGINCVYQYTTSTHEHITVLMGRITETSTRKVSIPEMVINIWKDNPESCPSNAIYGRCRPYIWIKIISPQGVEDQINHFECGDLKIAYCRVYEDGKSFFPTIESRIMGYYD